jgi:hypothetical protein
LWTDVLLLLYSPAFSALCPTVLLALGCWNGVARSNYGILQPRALDAYAGHQLVLPIERDQVFDAVRAEQTVDVGIIARRAFNRREEPEGMKLKGKWRLGVCRAASAAVAHRPDIETREDKGRPTHRRPAAPNKSASTREIDPG